MSVLFLCGGGTREGSARRRESQGAQEAALAWESAPALLRLTLRPSHLVSLMQWPQAVWWQEGRGVPGGHPLSPQHHTYGHQPMPAPPQSTQSPSAFLGPPWGRSLPTWPWPSLRRSTENFIISVMKGD